MAIERFELEEGEVIYVEVSGDKPQQVDIAPLQRGGVRSQFPQPHLPRGAEATSSEEVQAALHKGGEQLRKTIQGTAKAVKQSLEDLQPNEWTVELNIALKGKAAIPVLMETSSEGSIKITAKWKKD